MSTTTIACPNCGTEIALDAALAERFRHENEARLEALAGRVQARAREESAIEKRFLEE